MSETEIKSFAFRMPMANTLEIIDEAIQIIKNKPGMSGRSFTNAARKHWIAIQGTRAKVDPVLQIIQDLVEERPAVGDRADSRREKPRNGIQLQKLVLRAAMGYRERLCDLIHALPMLNSIEIEDVFYTTIDMRLILDTCHNLKSLLVQFAVYDEVTWCDSPSSRPQRSDSSSSLNNTDASSVPIIHGLERLALRQFAMDQDSLESLCAALPSLLSFEVRFLHFTSSPGSDDKTFKRKDFYRLLARTCPRIESLHFSLYDDTMKLDDSIIMQECFPELGTLSIAGKDMNSSSTDCQIRILDHYVNYVTTLEILCYTSSQGSAIMERLHEFLCQSRHLKHLKAPALQYWTEYLSLEDANESNSKDRSKSNNSEDEGEPNNGENEDEPSNDEEEQDSTQSRPTFYQPRFKAARKSWKWNVQSQWWACRQLETLHLAFVNLVRTKNDPSSFIVFGYISRHCPNLKDLWIVKDTINLNIDGGLCLLTRLKDLEKLRVESKMEALNMVAEDLDWIGCHRTSTAASDTNNSNPTISATETPTPIASPLDQVAKVFAADEEWYAISDKKRDSTMSSKSSITSVSKAEKEPLEVPLLRQESLPFALASESIYPCWPVLRRFEFVVPDPSRLFEQSEDFSMIRSLRPDIGFITDRKLICGAILPWFN
ncbi:hypothetical protein BGX27_007824 [Mortierella sp. AM989]|nr:hypothetical protein BGX27_007824 [Mortierella sp. AM989]